MKKRFKIKRSTKQYFIVALICFTVIGGAAIFTSIIMTSQIREEYQNLLDEAHHDMKLNQRRVFVAMVDIMAGDTITADKVENKTVYASQPEETYITAEGLGKVAIVNIPAETHIINSMLTDRTVSSELRELEYNVINISTNIISKDTIDVRIFYPNGESYVVLSKEIIREFISETATCFLWLNEEELLRMSAAIVDAGLYPGSRLYVTKYIEPSIQEASVVTYTPSLSILSVLESDPNIIERCSQELSKEVRKALENRMAESMDADVSLISWDINSNNRITPIITPVPTVPPEFGFTVTPMPTPSNQRDNTEATKQGEELGSASDFLFYAQEENAKEGDIEYGE